MKNKYYIVFILIIIFMACSNNEYNIENIQAPKNYDIFEGSVAKLDFKHAGTFLYNKSNREFDFLLDVSKEKDYEKYFPKRYFGEYIGDISKTQKISETFLDKGSDITSAYKIITYLYENKDNLSKEVKFNQYCLPEYYTIDYEKYGGKKLHKCYADFQAGSEIYRIRNLALLKARNMLIYAIDNQLKNEKDKIKAETYLLIALSYMAQDELYQFDLIKQYVDKWREFGGNEIKFFDKHKNKKLNTLFNYIADNKQIDIINILDNATKKGFINIITSTGGIYNYLNDDDYIPVTIMKRGESKYAINPFFIAYASEHYNVAEVLNRMSDIVKPIKPKGMYSYEVKNNLDEIYDNPLYILPFNEAVYILEMKDEQIVKVEFRNPAFYDTSYGTYDYMYYDELLIVNDYGFNIIEKDFIKNDNGSLKIVWKDNLKNNQIDKNSLFRLRGAIDCFNGNHEKLIYQCSNRGELIIAKHNKEIFQYSIHDKNNILHKGIEYRDEIDVHGDKSLNNSYNLKDMIK